MRRWSLLRLLIVPALVLGSRYGLPAFWALDVSPELRWPGTWILGLGVFVAAGIEAGLAHRSLLLVGLHAVTAGVLLYGAWVRALAVHFEATVPDPAPGAHSCGPNAGLVALVAIVVFLAIPIGTVLVALFVAAARRGWAALDSPGTLRA